MVQQIQLGKQALPLAGRTLPEAGRLLDFRTSSIARNLPAILDIAKQREIPGIIVDYDFLGQGFIEAEDMSVDYILPVLKAANCVTVITLRIDERRLAEQLRDRDSKRGMLRSYRSAFRRRVASSLMRFVSAGNKVLGPVASIRFQIFALRKCPALFLRYRNSIKRLKVDARYMDSERQNSRVERKLAFYEHEGKLQNLYRAWSSHIERVAAGGIDLEHLILEQQHDARSGSFSWRPVPDSRISALIDGRG